MSNYIPTTEEVRYAWEGCGSYVCGSPASDFDRWLSAHDAEIEREAFTRGFAAGDDARSTAELDALTAAELYMKQREAEIRADEREKAGLRVAALGLHGHAYDCLEALGHVQCSCALGDAISAARGGEQDVTPEQWAGDSPEWTL